MLPFNSDILNNKLAVILPIEAITLAQYASQVSNGYIVEVGTFLGGTTAILATYSKAIVVTVDKYILGTNPLTVYHSLQEFSNVIIIVGDSPTIGKLWSGNISFLFIDGGHQYEDVKADFESWSPHLTQDGIIAIHDACLPDNRISMYGYQFETNPGIERFISELQLTGHWNLFNRVGSTIFMKKVI